jgi:hypothetical protein
MTLLRSAAAARMRDDAQFPRERYSVPRPGERIRYSVCPSQEPGGPISPPRSASAHP